MNTQETSSAVKNLKSIESDFALRVQYKNNLPEIPFDTKFIPYNFDTKKFCNYETTSLEHEFNYEIYCEDDLGVNVNLIDIEQYHVDKSALAVLDPIDEILLKDDNNSEDMSKIKRSKRVSWLRRPVINPMDMSSFKSTASLENTIGGGSTPGTTLKNKLKTRDEQILAINQSFIDAKIPITTHHLNNTLKPVEFYPILPDEELWKYSFSHITFDSIPTIQGKGEKIGENLCKNAILKGMSDSVSEFVGYFVKNPQLNSFETESYLYEMCREYNWQIQNANVSPEDIFFFRKLSDGTMVYNEVGARVRLNKRRLPSGQLKNTECCTLLTVIPSAPTDDEITDHNKRMKIFSAPAKSSISISSKQTTHTFNKADKSSQGDEAVDYDELLNDFQLEDSSELGTKGQ